MKKIIRVILLFMILYLPVKVSAASIKINCPNSVTVGDTITCTVTGYHTSLAGLKASVTYSGMNYSNVSNLTGSNMFVVTKTELDGAFDVANTSKALAKYTFKASAKGNAKISISCQEIIDGTDFSSVSCGSASKTIEIKAKEVAPPVPKSSDATLKKIEISTGNIKFKSDEYEYNLEVDYETNKIEVNGILNDSKATVKLEGETNLTVGNNVLKLNVTAEDGITKKTYTLNIRRKEKVLSTNSEVKNITVNNYDIGFQKLKKEYDLTISNEKYLTINIELEDEFAKYEIIGNKNLENGSVITIKITAENGNTNQYIINIIKEKNLTDILSLCLIISVFLNISLLISLLITMFNRKKSS